MLKNVTDLKGYEARGNFFILFHVNTGISKEEKSRLLHCVVIGGGPTGVEFSGELSDFIIKDVHERYSHVKDYIHVTLIEVSSYEKLKHELSD